MRPEERAARMLEAAQASRADLRSILRLERIAIKGAYDPALLTPVEIEELCASVLRHLTWEPGRAGPSRAALTRTAG